MTIKFGPAGLGPVANAEKVLGQYKKFGFKICEIAFTYSVYIKKDDAERIGKKAKELGIDLSIHAPYFINLNSLEKEKVEASKKRILKCCEIGEELGVKRVVFHPGYYGKMSREETYENIKKDFSIEREFNDIVIEENTVFCQWAEITEGQDCLKCIEGKLKWTEQADCKGLSCNP